MSDSTLSETSSLGNNQFPDCTGSNESFKCPHPNCDKYFLNKSVLDRHLRVHTGEKPFPCPICGKLFSQQGNMTKHLKTHENSHLKWDRNTNSKPYKCHFPNCCKSFTAKTTLQNHLMTCHRKRKLDFQYFIKEEQEEHDDGHDDEEDSDSDHHQSHQSHQNSRERSHKHRYFSHSHPHTHVFTHCHAHSHVSSDDSLSNDDHHDDNNLVFENEEDLRNHIYAFTPGLTAEHNFLVDSMINISDMLLSWDEKTPEQKDSIKAYVKTMKGMVSEMKINPSNETTRHKHLHTHVSSEENSQVQLDLLNKHDQNDPTSLRNQPDLLSNKTNHSNHQQPYQPPLSTLPTMNEISYQDLELSNDISTLFDHDFLPPNNNSTSESYSIEQPLNNYQPQLTDNHWNTHMIDSQSNYPLTSQYTNNISSYPQTNSQSYCDPSLISDYSLHRTLFSWEEAIVRSKTMLMEGNNNPLFIIHPCSTANSYLQPQNMNNTINNTLNSHNNTTNNTSFSLVNTNHS